MGMIQPCSKDGGTGGERQEHEGGREGGYRQHMEQEKKNWKGEEEKDEEERAAAEMIMIGTTNGESLHTVQSNSPGRRKEGRINRERRGVNEAR